ncbi:hypothetical protein ACIRVF_39220 [Kitasatospora sp. NPDC101157]|uniref:hypothetical protein n=1 Tax=Kitasatospora sp. NPDC101157 TaxID=3364098 RepID=UPI003801E132
MVMVGKPAAMSLMEHPENTIAVPPFVDQRVLIQFCQAVQTCADGQGLHDVAARSLNELRADLAALTNLAALCRLAILGQPHAFARVVDEMHCIAVDHPAGPLDTEGEEDEFCEDETDDRVQLAAAIDLLAGAAFVSKDRPRQRDRFIIGIVRAIENAIAFPVVLSRESAAYLGQGPGTLLPLEASSVIANATQRLIEGDQKCVPRPPAEIRRRLETLARRWMRGNPVTTFLEALSGLTVHQIVQWVHPGRTPSDDSSVGDPLTLLLRPDRDEAEDDEQEDRPCGYGAMFCPHQPAEVVRPVKNGLQVRIPEGATSGPVAVLKHAPDFRKTWDLIVEFGRGYPVEMSASIFGLVRMDGWAYPFAFGGPKLEIARRPRVTAADAFTPAGPLTNDHPVAVGEEVAIHYRVSPAGSGTSAPPSVDAPGGVVTQGPRPGVILYRPVVPGRYFVELAWGDSVASIPIHAQADLPAGEQP